MPELTKAQQTFPFLPMGTRMDFIADPHSYFLSPAFASDVLMDLGFHVWTSTFI